MDIKPGYKTTEFWMTIIASSIAVLIAGGILTAEEGNALKSAGNQLVGAISALVLAAGPVMVYVNGRSKIKASEVEASVYATPINTIENATIEPAE